MRIQELRTLENTNSAAYLSYLEDLFLPLCIKPGSKLPLETGLSRAIIRKRLFYRVFMFKIIFLFFFIYLLNPDFFVRVPFPEDGYRYAQAESYSDQYDDE